MSPMVELRGVTRTFRTAAGAVPALSGVDLAVHGGELVALVGPSGSGKSTLLRLIVGWERPDDGTVTVAPEVTGRSGWSGLAVVPQELGLIDELTAAQNVAIAADLAGVSADGAVTDRGLVGDRLAEGFGLVGLLARRPSELSLGEQQRVAVARALVASPRLLVADEPTAHQDAETARVVMARLGEAAAEGAAVLVATHDRRALAVADRVVEISDGRVARH